MSVRIKPHKVKGRQLEEVREKDPDGRIVYHHRTVDTLGKMLRAGTITPEMHEAAQDFQANFIIAQLDTLRALPVLRVPGRRIPSFAGCDGCEPCVAPDALTGSHHPSHEGGCKRRNP
jgi:hypothetical protein